MHELSIAQALVDEIERVADQEGALSVTRVRVAIGALSGVDPDALSMAFPVAAEATRAAGADLDVELVASRVRCRACGTGSSPEFPFLCCESCGSTDVEVQSGRELLITSVELECRREETGSHAPDGNMDA